MNRFLPALDKIAERIRKTGLKQSGKLGTFLISETCIFTVCLRILQVYFLMRHVQVTTHNDRFLFFQFFR